MLLTKLVKTSVAWVSVDFMDAGAKGAGKQLKEMLSWEASSSFILKIQLNVTWNSCALKDWYNILKGQDSNTKPYAYFGCVH